MMKKVFFAALAFAAIPAVSSAAIIDFAGFSDLTVLTTQNFGDGITFAGVTILQCCKTDGSGSLNNATFPPPLDDGGSTDGVNVAFNSSGNVILDFTTPVDFFSAAFTYSDGLTVTAYNSASAVIATVDGGCSSANFAGSGCGTPDEVLSVSVAAISSIVISGGPSNSFAFDDVNFPGAINAGVVPEPGTLAMGLGGLLACLAAFGRRRCPAAAESK